MAIQISIDWDAIVDFCKRNHIRKLALFGAVTRDDFGPGSDVDVLVEFEPGCTPGFALFDMQTDLATLLHRPVDLLTHGFISPLIRDQVEREAIVLYDAPR
jgi:predicted nucleotidyltransferase